jgi:hypothetical protein
MSTPPFVCLRAEAITWRAVSGRFTAPRAVSARLTRATQASVGKKHRQVVGTSSLIGQFGFVERPSSASSPFASLSRCRSAAASDRARRGDLSMRGSLENGINGVETDVSWPLYWPEWWVLHIFLAPTATFFVTSCLGTRPVGQPSASNKYIR